MIIYSGFNFYKPSSNAFKLRSAHIILVVVDKEVCDNYESLIRRSFSERMGNRISIEINIVPSIKTASGKLRFVLNEVIDNKS